MADIVIQMWTVVGQMDREGQWRFFQKAGLYEEIGEEVQFLMVNQTAGRETMKAAAALIEERGYTFPVFYDTEM